MSENRENDTKTPTSGGKDDRAARRADALRANLHRRKAQSRGRRDAEAGGTAKAADTDRET